MLLVQIKNHVDDTRQYVAHKVMYEEMAGCVTLVMPAYIVVRVDGHDTYIENGVIHKTHPISNIVWMSCDYTKEA